MVVISSNGECLVVKAMTMTITSSPILSNSSKLKKIKLIAIQELKKSPRKLKTYASWFKYSIRIIKIIKRGQNNNPVQANKLTKNISNKIWKSNLLKSNNKTSNILNLPKTPNYLKSILIKAPQMKAYTINRIYLTKKINYKNVINKSFIYSLSSLTKGKMLLFKKLLQPMILSKTCVPFPINISKWAKYYSWTSIAINQDSTYFGLNTNWIFYKPESQCFGPRKWWETQPQTTTLRWKVESMKSQIIYILVK